MFLLFVLLSFMIPFYKTNVSSIENEKSINEFTCEINELLNTYGIKDKHASKDTTCSYFTNNTIKKFDDTIEFETMRLIVNSNTTIDTLNAVSVISGYEDLWILQFETVYDTKVAYDYYKSLEYVEFVEPDEIISLSEITFVESEHIEETQYLSWGPEHIGLDTLNNYLVENNVVLSTVTVAVLDTGIDHTHSFLKGRVEPTGFNSSDSGLANSSMDDKGHGTHIAGIIADCTPQNIIIKPYKVLNNKGNGTTISVLSGIYKAIEDKTDIINMSFCRSSDSTSIHKAIAEADEKGIVIVAASGNSGTNKIKYYPACYDEVIAVSSISQNNVLSDFSNYGTYIDLSAPGSEIKSTTPNDKKDTKSGTSMAAPFVSSVAALAKSYHGNISSQAVKTLLYSSATSLLGDNEYGEYFGNGLVNAMGILGKIKDSPENLIITTPPLFNCQAGVYETFVDVSLECEDENAIIYYTTDGSNPNRDSSIYDGKPIHIEKNTVISATACAESRRMSRVVRCEYRIIKEFNENMVKIDEEGYILSCVSEVNEIIIPEKIRGVTIKGVRQNAFSNEFDEKNFFSYIKLPNTVTHIEKNAFSKNANITEIIADGVIQIDDYAFSECTSLNQISLKSVKSIEKHAFYKTGTSIKNKQYIAEMPELEDIGSYAFADSKIKTVVFPKLTSLGDSAFQNCKSLVSVWCDEVLEIPDFTFYNCTNLKNISLSHCKRIGIMSFYHCKELETVELPECIILKESTFDSCYQLLEVYLPQVVEMDATTFNWCDCLEKLNLPCLETIVVTDNYIGLPTSLKFFSAPKISTVPDWFFSNLPLQKVYIPSVKTLGEYAFSGIDSLSYLDISSVESISTDSTFSEVRNIGFIKANNLTYAKSIPEKSTILVSSKFKQIDYAPKELTVYGIRGSFAESFANENNYTFIPIPYVDSNLLNEKITSSETVTVDAIGFNLTYQWYLSYNNSTDNSVAIDGATEKTLDISNVDYAPYYYCVVICTENNKSYITETKIIKNSDYALADFKKVDEALSEIPINLSIYTQESVDVLNTAIEQINRDTANNKQELVDKWAEELSEAIKNLVLKPADYTELERILATVPKDLSIYTEESVKTLQTVVDNIDYSLDITEQHIVDDYVIQIEEARNNLKKECWLISLFEKILLLFKNILSKIAWL